MGRLLAAALLTGAVAAGASPVVPERDHERITGASPVVPERDHERITGASPVVPRRDNEIVAGANPVVPKRDNETVAGANPVVPEPDEEVEVCAGAAVMPFERRLPEQVRRFAFDGAMVEPFLRLWQSGDRPELPLSPESVIVYAAPNRPYVVGYERRGCMIAFLAVPPQELWHWLRPSVGWLTELPSPPGPRGTA